MNTFFAASSGPAQGADKHSPLPSPAERVLLDAGIAFRRLEYEYHEKGGTADAARQLGLNEHFVVKSLVFDDAQPVPQSGVMALMHGDCRVSLRRLERLAQAPRLAPASPQNALRLCGYTPGGICPFGLVHPLPVFVQSSLLQLERLYINAGQRGVVLEIAPTALAITGAIAGDFMAATG